MKEFLFRKETYIFGAIIIIGLKLASCYNGGESSIIVTPTPTPAIEQKASFQGDVTISEDCNPSADTCTHVTTINSNGAQVTVNTDRSVTNITQENEKGCGVGLLVVCANNDSNITINQP